MPLLDHFHSPLSEKRHWESFHGSWAYEIMAQLNREVLPAEYFAEAQVHIGSRVEVDVASFEHGESLTPVEVNGGVAVQTWSPPTVTSQIPAVFPDEIEVQIFQQTAGPTLVAAIELVSPGNQDRAEVCRVFAMKCAAYLQTGVGVLIVDVVTNRSANLHDVLVELMGNDADHQFGDVTPLYATAYRPLRDEAGDKIDLWLRALELGEPLPIMPLALRGGPTLPVDLDASYREVCARSRL